jgi:TPR repeat protein
MTGSSTPRQAEPGSPAPHHRPALADLEAIIQQHLAEIVQGPDPRMHVATAFSTGAVNLPPSLAARLQMLAPVDTGLATFLDQIESALRSKPMESDVLGEDDIDVDTPLGLAPIGAPQLCMQALVHDFARRQRRATLLVAGCVAISCMLTVVGIAALASLAGSNADGSVNSSNLHSSSMTWRGPENPMLQLASASPNRSGKSDALFIRARLDATDASPPSNAPAESRGSAPELILMQQGRPLLLGPLLKQRQARYTLIRGLPREAKLSVGQRNPSGAWLVRDKDIGALTLSIGGDASGDYTAEIYALGAGALPQGRQRLVFRVEPAFVRAAAEGNSIDSSLMTRAMRLIDEGDIAGARLLFHHLAEQGEADAAYELGRTFDPEVLAGLGVEGLGADRATALNWYERASETGNKQAKERLRILASLSG